MRAIEFLTQIEEGIIRVPKKYAKSLQGIIRIIILFENERRKMKFSALAIGTKDLYFDKDEANER